MEFLQGFLEPFHLCWWVTSLALFLEAILLFRKNGENNLVGLLMILHFLGTAASGSYLYALGQEETFLITPQIFLINLLFLFANCILYRMTAPRLTE